MSNPAGSVAARRVSPEKLALVEKALEDGWPFAEISRTHHITAVTLRRHFPGRGWTPKQGAELGYTIMKEGLRA